MNTSISITEQSVKSASGQECKFGRGFAEFEGFVKLPLIMLRTFGPRTLTLSALMALPEVRLRGCTFRGIETLGENPGIAESSGIPIRTVKRHLKELEREGAVINRGRHGRRTVDRAVDSSIREAYKVAPS